MRFWQQPNVIVFVWFGIGLSRIFCWGGMCLIRFLVHQTILTSWNARLIKSTAKCFGARCWGDIGIRSIHEMVSNLQSK